ncbi:hypothetical protein J6590_071900 [Homalodisca vitripennis]|nr:hypothetical protein J6590_071900 [Homalodisca vitripennis]
MSVAGSFDAQGIEVIPGSKGERGEQGPRGPMGPQGMKGRRIYYEHVYCVKWMFRLKVFVYKKVCFVLTTSL